MTPQWLITGEKGMGRSGKPLHFKGSTFHRVIPDFMCQVKAGVPQKLHSRLLPQLTIESDAQETLSMQYLKKRLQMHACLKLVLSVVTL